MASIVANIGAQGMKAGARTGAKVAAKQAGKQTAKKGAKQAVKKGSKKAAKKASQKGAKKSGKKDHKKIAQKPSRDAKKKKKGPATKKKPRKGEHGLESESTGEETVDSSGRQMEDVMGIIGRSRSEKPAKKKSKKGNARSKSTGCGLLKLFRLKKSNRSRQPEVKKINKESGLKPGKLVIIPTSTPEISEARTIPSVQSISSTIATPLTSGTTSISESEAVTSISETQTSSASTSEPLPIPSRKSTKDSQSSSLVDLPLGQKCAFPSSRAPQTIKTSGDVNKSKDTNVQFKMVGPEFSCLQQLDKLVKAKVITEQAIDATDDREFNLMLFNIAKHVMMDEVEKKKATEMAEKEKKLDETDWLKALRMALKADRQKRQSSIQPACNCNIPMREVFCPANCPNLPKPTSRMSFNSESTDSLGFESSDEDIDGLIDRALESTQRSGRLPESDREKEDSTNKKPRQLDEMDAQSSDDSTESCLVTTMPDETPNFFKRVDNIMSVLRNDNGQVDPVSREQNCFCRNTDHIRKRYKVGDVYPPSLFNSHQQKMDKLLSRHCAYRQTLPSDLDSLELQFAN